MEQPPFDQRHVAGHRNRQLRERVRLVGTVRPGADPHRRHSGDSAGPQVQRGTVFSGRALGRGAVTGGGPGRHVPVGPAVQRVQHWRLVGRRGDGRGGDYGQVRPPDAVPPSPRPETVHPVYTQFRFPREQREKDHPIV